jgi:hypothetical protein
VTLDEIERRFHRAMISIYETAKRELGYNATRFLQMTSEQGGLAVARQLLGSDAPSEGFTTLRPMGGALAAAIATRFRRILRKLRPSPEELFGTVRQLVERVSGLVPPGKSAT